MVPNGEEEALAASSHALSGVATVRYDVMNKDVAIA
jgi:hypothetical protein